MKITSHGKSMPQSNEPEKPLELVNVKGPTSTSITVQIDRNGDLLFSGYDLGKGPKEFWGNSDYEYWLRIPAKHKDQVLLALIEKAYSGNTRTISEVKKLFLAREIPCNFSTWT